MRTPSLMEKNPDKKAKGFAEMSKFITKGRAVELSEEEDRRQREEGGPIWYLPVHLVFQHGKYRFCHDGRAETKGICLNETLIGDLNLMNPITDQTFVQADAFGLGSSVMAKTIFAMLEDQMHGKIPNRASLLSLFPIFFFR